ncbi:hypothetical protein DXG03_006581 [Asterophora parasitica]|uniref:Cytochrome P450 n=1 Tax=Asterophora parasitica TaxID=117018 RepID=A0A9P7G7G7_9AGAR|nr:hypothetical protein DXG03_006581 [Asterophora parasitica]
MSRTHSSRRTVDSRQGTPLISRQELASRFTLDSATEFLFGNDVGSLSAGLTYPPPSLSYPHSPSYTEEHPSNRFVNAFLAGQTLISLRSRYGPSWALVEFWRDEVRPHRAVVDELVEPILEEALRNNRARTADAGQDLKDKLDEGDERNGGTLLDHLVRQTQDRQILKDELINLLVAARDTTGSTLTFAMYMLTQHPAIVKRLREEILLTVGSTSRPTYEQIKDLKYMRAFINGQFYVSCNMALED